MSVVRSLRPLHVAAIACLLAAGAALAAATARAEGAGLPAFVAGQTGFTLVSRGVRLAVDPDGAAVLSAEGGAAGARFRFEVQGVGFGEAETGHAGGSARARLDPDGRVLRIARSPTLTEIYETHAEGVAQSFRIAALPADGPGDLVLEARLVTDLTLCGSPEGREGISLVDESGRSVLRYGAATAIDAAGRRRDARMELDGDRVRIVIDRAFAEAAKLPLVIDPVTTASEVIVSVQSNLELRPDAAYSVTEDAYIIAFDRDQVPAAGRREIWVGRYASDETPLDPDPNFPDTNAVPIASSVGAGVDSIAPKVAWLGGGFNRYLVVWLDPIAKSVKGALVNADGPKPPTITALAGPIATLAAGETDIDDVVVGGRLDGAGYCVAWHVTGTASNHVRALIVSGSGATSTAVTLSTDATAAKSRLAINKVAAAGQDWLVVWSQAGGATGLDLRSRPCTLAPAAGGAGDNLLAGAAADEERASVAGVGPAWGVAYNVRNGGGDLDVWAACTLPNGSGAISGSAFPLVADAAASDVGPAMASIGQDFFTCWIREGSATTPTAFVGLVRFDASVTLPTFLEGPIFRTPSGQLVTYTAATAAARLRGPPSTVGYLAGYTRHVTGSGGPDANPRFVLTESLTGAAIEVRTQNGPIIAAGSAGVGPRHFGGVQTTATSAPLQIQIRNIGASTLTLGTPGFTAAAPDFHLDATGLSTSVAAGAVTTFTATFQPNSTGSKRATVTFTHNAATGGPSPFTFELGGVGLSGNPDLQTVTATPNLTIPDDDAAGIRSTIFVPPGAEVLNVTVTVDIGHPFVNDIEVFVESPDGTFVTLASFVPTGGADMLGTTFDDAAAVAISAGSAPFSGRFQPETPLAALRGRPSTGDWTLIVRDMAAGDIGTLGAWTLTIERDPVGPVPGIDVREVSSAGPAIRNGAQAAGGRAFGNTLLGQPREVTISIKNNGTATLNLGTPTLALHTDFDIDTASTGFTNAVGAGLATEFKVRFDPQTRGLKSDEVSIAHDARFTTATPFKFKLSGRGLDQAPTTASFVPAIGLPATIPDFTPLGVTSRAFCALSGEVLSVTVTNVNITHAFASDLELLLVAPDGRRILLAQGQGVNNGPDYVNATFTDFAPQSIIGQPAPIAGSFRPQDPLSTFSSTPTAAYGFWSLEVDDFVFRDVGTLDDWRLDVTATGPGVPTPVIVVLDAAANRVLGPADSIHLGAGVVGAAPAGPRTFAISNAGTAALTVTTPTAAGANPADFTVSATGFPASLAPGATRSFDVALTPTGFGLTTAAIQMSHNSTTTSANPLAFEVRGAGVAKLVTFTATNLPLQIPDFNPNGVEATIPVTTGGEVLWTRVTITVIHDFTNDLEVDLVHPDGSFVLLSFLNGGNFDFIDTTFDDAAAVSILDGTNPYTGRFLPEEPLARFDHKAAGSVTSPWSLLVADRVPNDVGTLTAVVLELGVGPAPEIQVLNGAAPISAGQAGAVPFADRLVTGGPSAPIAITIRNPGTATLSLGTPTVSGGGVPFSLDTTGFSTSVLKGAQTSFQVIFDPNAAGTLTATVSVTHDGAPIPSPFTFGVTGRGLAPAIAVVEGAGSPIASGSLIDFGSQGTGAGPTAARTFTIRNTGSSALTLGTPALGGSSPGAFSLDLGAFAASVPAGGATTLAIRFDPSTTVLLDATVQFTHDGAGQPTPFALALQGTGVASVSAGGGGGGGGCSTGGAPDFATPAFGAALAALVFFRRRAPLRGSGARPRTR